MNDRVSLGNPTQLRITGAMTVSAWILPRGFNTSGRIVSRGGASGSRGWSLATATTVQYVNSLNITIGARPTTTGGNPDTPFNGLIDSVRIYDEALTEAQIQALPELVQTPLTFTLEPVSVAVLANSSVTFSSAFAGSPPYSIQWYENGAPNPPYTNAVVPGENRFFRLLATP